METLRLLVANDELIAVDKPEGIATIPERIEREHCLQRLLEQQTGARPFVVHRLDKEVSGVIVFARSAAAHRHLCLQFERHEVRKLYTALVLGVPPEQRGVIERPVRQFGSGRMGIDTARGKPCRTEFEVVERLDRHAILSVHPLTGRRHQIRVHLYSLGHPVAGDPRYGDAAAQARYGRLMLHSSRLELRLLSGEALAIESALPESFQRVLQSVRSGGLA